MSIIRSVPDIAHFNADLEKLSGIDAKRTFRNEGA